MGQYSTRRNTLAGLLYVGIGLFWLAQKYKEVGSAPRLSFDQIHSLSEQQLQILLKTTTEAATAHDKMIVGVTDVLQWGGLLVIGATVWILVGLYSAKKAQLGAPSDPRKKRAVG